MLLNCGVVSFGTLRWFHPFSDVITIFVSPFGLRHVLRPETYVNHLRFTLFHPFFWITWFFVNRGCDVLVPVLLKILVSFIDSGLFLFCCVPYWFSAFTWDSEKKIGLLLQPFDWIKKTFFEKPEPEAWVSRHKRLQVCNCNFDTPLLSGMIPDWRELG